MPKHRIGTQEEWKAEREELIKKEKELTHRGDELTKERQALPWVRSRRTTSSRPPTGPSRWPSSSTGARS